MEYKTTILDELSLTRAIKRISHEIIEHNNGVEDLILVGIKTRGVPFAKIIQKNFKDLEGIEVPLEEIDITLYRDDLTEINKDATLNKDEIVSDVAGKTVILCDDVLYTGRTCRAAIDAVLKHGRPKSIQFAVVIDRGHRELPIRADYVGKNVPTSHSEVIAVKFKEIDKIDSVELYQL
ncbi:MAG: bifunctional pyr operon transcriptional regulator/uracil phosphoribosyltransferase PyrR [Bacilli bacterium]|nr:bifunctional pyr operon transcriptional regulator/uracil phosphoribosyltransferase PyrR [Bacilli bacterium]